MKLKHAVLSALLSVFIFSIYIAAHAFMSDMTRSDLVFALRIGAILAGGQAFVIAVIAGTLLRLSKTHKDKIYVVYLAPVAFGLVFVVFDSLS